MTLRRAVLSAIVLTLAACGGGGGGPGGNSIVSIRGRLVLRGNASAADIAVNLLGQGVARTARTAQDGSFSFAALPPGNYNLTPAAPFLESKTTPIGAFYGDLDAGELERMTFGQVSGVVTLADGGDPSNVAITVQGSEWVARADATGRYTLPWAPAGTQKLTAVARGYLLSSVPISLSRGEKISAPDMALQPGAAESLPTIYGTSDLPPNTRITVDGTDVHGAVDSFGAFSIPDAPLGYLELVLRGGLVRGRISVVSLPGTFGFQVETVTRQNDIIAQRLVPLQMLHGEWVPAVAEAGSTLLRLPEQQGARALFHFPVTGKDALVPLDSEQPADPVLIEAGARQYQFTADGTSLLYAVRTLHGAMSSELKRQSVDGGAPAFLATDMMTGTPFLVTPDSSRVIYVACCAGSSTSLRAAGLSGGAPVTLHTFAGTDFLSWERNAIVTADSTRLVFLEGGALRVVSLDTGVSMTLAELPDDSTFQMTHDGKHIVYSKGQAGPISAVAADGESEPVAFQYPGSILAISDDDAHVLTISSHRFVFVTDLEGRKVQNDSLFSSATLLPDGNTIVWVNGGQLQRSVFTEAELLRDTFCVQPVPTLIISTVLGSTGPENPLYFPLPRTFAARAAEWSAVDYQGSGRQAIYEWESEPRICSSHYGDLARIVRTRGDEAGQDVTVGLLRPTAFPYVPGQRILFEFRDWDSSRGEVRSFGYYSLPME